MMSELLSPLCSLAIIISDQVYKGGVVCKMYDGVVALCCYAVVCGNLVLMVPVEMWSNLSFT